MKIRNGFVSNSSSSSYVVEVPKGFTITADELLSDSMIEELDESGLLGDVECWDNVEIPQEAVDKVNELFAKLASGKGIYRGNWKDPCQVFWVLVELLEKHNLVVMKSPAPGGDGEDTIVPFEDLRKGRK